MVKTSSRAVGRPPQSLAPALNAAIVEAAAKVFLSNGFSNTTMRQIAEEARVSPQTLYARFKDKTKLYEALMEERTTALLSAMAGLLQDDSPPPEALHAFGVTLLSTFLGTDLQRLQQMVIAEVKTFPGLAQAFYRAGPQRGRTLLIAYLKQCVERGQLKIEHIEIAAEQFIGSVVGGIVIRATLAQELNILSEDETTTWVRAAVEMFLSAYSIEAKACQKVNLRSTIHNEAYRPSFVRKGAST